MLHRNFEQGPAGNVLGTLKSFGCTWWGSPFILPWLIELRSRPGNTSSCAICCLTHICGWPYRTCGNRGLLEALGGRSSYPREALQQVAILVSRYSCDILSAFWRGQEAATHPAPDAPGSSHCEADVQSAPDAPGSGPCGPDVQSSCGMVTPAWEGWPSCRCCMHTYSC